MGPPSKQMTLAMLSGKMQYPRTHTDWKKEIFPPRSSAFTVTTCSGQTGRVQACIDEAKTRQRNSPLCCICVGARAAHRCAAADDDEHRSEHKRLLIVWCKPGEQCRKRQAQHERTPQVPILEGLNVRLAWVEHAHHLVANHGQIPHDGGCHRLVESPHVRPHALNVAASHGSAKLGHFECSNAEAAAERQALAGGAAANSGQRHRSTRK
eukprot:scaffold19191_cov134-Isochrysis_galbana.AAC.8